ncbi:hypothetical protein QYF61_016333 [Mycteria americana]|uniref:RNase H type-1 domain-containing protein n=1 Tax=Mycteria americana TaxID=33587 RepID=A0AAN7PIV5_MYCAM|nr:hypothetical protein QYF61_016333 [Mycteria americana]
MVRYAVVTTTQVMKAEALPHRKQIHTHGAIWKERGLLSAQGSPIKYKEEILQLLQDIQQPKDVVVMHCKAHQFGQTLVNVGNRLADKTAREAAEQSILALVPVKQVKLPTLKPNFGKLDRLLAEQLRAEENEDGWWGWRLNHFPGQPVPMLDNPFSEVKFPNIQSKPPLAQLEAISSCPITCYLGEETDPHLSTTSFQIVVESDKTLHQLRCPSLDTLQHLNVSLVVRGPKLNTVFEVRPHQCRVQGHNHFPSPAGHAIFDTSQDTIGFLGRLGTLLAHIQAAVNKHPQVLFCLAAFQPLFPKPVALHGVAVAQVQDLALGLVEPHKIDLGPLIQPVQSLPTLKHINTPAQLGVTCKLTEGALDPFVQIIDKDIKQNWPQHRALGNTACDRLPTGVNSIHHPSLGPAVQAVLYPAKSTPVQAMSSQFLQENAVGNRVKGFTEV